MLFNRRTFIKQVGILNILFISGLGINVLGYGFILGYFLILSMFVFRSQFVLENWDRTGLWLLLFSIVHGLFYALNPEKGVQYILVYIATPITLYLWGKYLFASLSKSEQFYALLLVIGFLLAIPALLSVMLNIMDGGFAQSDRNIPMFWSNTKMNATGMAAHFIFAMCIPAILASSRDYIGFKSKLLLAIFYVLSMVCVLRLGSRTQLGITMLSFLAALAYILPRQNVKRNALLFAIISLSVFFIVEKVSFDLDANWLNSFSRRLEKGGAGEVASGGGRTNRWVKSFDYMVKMPLGWDVKEFGHSHNLWLDMYRSGGVIVFFLLLIFSIRAGRDIWKAIRINLNKISLNTVLLTYGMAFYLLFMVEPVIDGSFNLFALFCLFIGMVNKYYSTAKKEL